jgi:CheY-like chemotaxis protein
MPATLLLADDNPAVQKMMQLTFAGQDIRIVTVDDGEAAIARLAEDTPDIVLAAVSMSGRDGYEVASHIKHDPGLCHIPVLLMTGAFEAIDQARASEAKCDGVLAKPIEPPVVVARVKELLEAAAAPAHPLGDYFEKLDAAFARLSQPAQERASAARPPAPTHEAGGSSDALPSLLAPTEQPGASASHMPGAAVSDVVEPVAPAPRPSRVLPADRDRDQPVIVSEEFVDRVAQRVLERLSDSVVREKTTEIVSTVAERLVREELDRLKAAIRNL